MITEQTYHHLSCNECGMYFKDENGFSWFADKEKLMQDVEQSEWHTISEEKHLCPLCKLEAENIKEYDTQIDDETMD